MLKSVSQTLISSMFPLKNCVVDVFDAAATKNDSSVFKGADLFADLSNTPSIYKYNLVPL